MFVGYGIVAPEYAWNDYANIDVHGKTVVVLANDPGYATKDPTVFKGSAMTYYGRWAYKVEEAARQGAAGVLLIHDAARPGLRLERGRRTPGAARSWNWRRRTAMRRRAAIEGWIQNDAARALFAPAGLDFAAAAAAAAHPGFKAMRARAAASTRRCTTACASSTPPT